MRIIDELMGYLSPQAFRVDKDSNNYKILNAFANRLEDIQKALNQIKTDINVDVATGVDLARLGNLFGLERKVVETDDTFRTRIKGYWNSKKGGGSLSDIQRMLELHGAKNVNITEYYLRIFVQFSIVDELADFIVSLIFKIKSAGVYPLIFIDGLETEVEQLKITDNDFFQTVQLNFLTVENGGIDTQEVLA